MKFPAWVLASLLTALSACSKPDAPPPVAHPPEVVLQNYISGEVTCALPKHWKFESGSSGSGSESKRWRFLAMAGQGKSIFAQVLITADQTSLPPDVEGVIDYQRANFKIPKENESVIDDVADGNWRTVISAGKLEGIPALILDRHGVEKGIVVTLRIIHPVGEQSSSAIVRAVADFNAVVRSLKIGGSNVIHNEVTVSHGAVWIRRAGDAAAGGPPAAEKAFQLPGPATP